MEPNPRDEAILAFLARTDAALPPTPIHENLVLSGVSVSSRTVHRRLKALAEAGYVEKVLAEKGYYRVTDRGRTYVENELSVADTDERRSE